VLVEIGQLKCIKNWQAYTFKYPKQRSVSADKPILSYSNYNCCASNLATMSCDCNRHYINVKFPAKFGNERMLIMPKYQT